MMPVSIEINLQKNKIKSQNKFFKSRLTEKKTESINEKRRLKLNNKINSHLVKWFINEL